VGVTSVVARLFGIVQPDAAVFGRKDFQQLAIIRRMAQDLCMPIEIIGAPTVRAEDGLALSSRNQYLSVEERAQAPALYRSLQQAVKALQALSPKGISSEAIAAIEDESRAYLQGLGFKVDNFVVRVAASLLPYVYAAEVPGVVLAAARLGRARLIDNLEFDGI
jgi:pantoate--beta-alanine ligase